MCTAVVRTKVPLRDAVAQNQNASAGASRLCWTLRHLKFMWENRSSHIISPIEDERCISRELQVTLSPHRTGTKLTRSPILINTKTDHFGIRIVTEYQFNEICLESISCKSAVNGLEQNWSAARYVCYIFTFGTPPKMWPKIIQR